MNELAIPIPTPCPTPDITEERIGDELLVFDNKGEGDGDGGDGGEGLQVT